MVSVWRDHISPLVGLWVLDFSNLTGFKPKPGYIAYYSIYFQIIEYDVKKKPKGKLV